MIKCPRIPGHLTLSVASCASQHRAAQTKEWAHRLPHCADCPIGAKNAGLEVAPPFKARMVCVRCGCGASRMVLGRLCLSCYNREREWRVGRNAKGQAPKQFRALGRYLFTCPANGRRYQVDATCSVEARLAAQKLWGLVDLVLDRRQSVLATQVTIFETGGCTHAATPRCS